MKNLKQFAKKLLAMIVATTIILSSTTSVNAAADSIQLGDASYSGNYIAGVYFSDKKTTDGKYLYCVEMPKKTAQNVKATLVKNSKNIVFDNCLLRSANYSIGGTMTDVTVASENCEIISSTVNFIPNN